MVRSTRRDDVQEDLVSKKDVANKITSDVIDELIDAKDAWNGKAAPRIGVTEPHSLSEPIPPEAVETINNVVQKVQEINSRVKEIERLQSGHQNIRKERAQKKAPKGEEPLDLSSIASNVGTRFMSHIKAPFQFGDDDKWARLRLLRSSAKVERHLEDMQGYILSSSKDAVPSAVYKAKDLLHIFENEIVEPMISAVKELPEKAPERDLAQEQSNEESDNYRIDPFGGGDSDKYQPADIIGGTKVMKDQLRAARDRVPSESFKPFTAEYNNILRRISYIVSMVNNNYDEAEREYRNLIIDMEDFMNRTGQLSDVFQKAAVSGGRDPVNWFKRKNVELLHSRYDHMRGMRLKADDAAKNARDDLNHFMNALEKSHINPASLSVYLKDFMNSLAMLYRYVYKLGDIHNSRSKLKNYKSKGSDKWPVISEMDLRSLHRAFKEISSMKVKLESLQELHG